jgi:TolA-binding protein
MTHEADELDQQLAERLARVADSDPACAPRLDASARRRVLATLIQDSARRARKRRNVYAASALAAVAACAGVAWMLQPSRDARPATDAVVAAPGACGLPTTSTGVQIVAEAARQHITLGRFGQLAAERDAALQIVSSTPCELTIALTRGMVAGDLHDLRPARLRVLTALGDVEVRGTTFSVRVDEADRALEVVLVHGAVDVVKGDQLARLMPGQTLRRAARAAPRLQANTESAAVAIEALIAGSTAASGPRTPELSSPPKTPGPSEPRASDAAVSDAPPRPSAAPSATELLASAERERRAGRLDAARAAYREAGTRRGADAEVALLRWARLELSAHAADAARDVLGRYRKRFTDGRLAAEASWLELRALEELGDIAAARAVARQLIQAYPDSPHAHAAARLLAAP